MGSPKITPDTGDLERWLLKGNASADAKAKEALRLYATRQLQSNPAWVPALERKLIADARLATRCCHDMSQHLLSLTKKHTPEEEEDDFDTRGPPMQLDVSKEWIFPFPMSFQQQKWDPKWLQLVVAHFSQLNWPSQDAPPSEVSCLELMLDLMIHYQVAMLINTTYLRKIGGPSTISWDQNNSSFYLPSRKEAMSLPEPLLTELSRVWLFTLEYLRTEVAMTSVPRTSTRSLRHFAYNNSVPSFAMRPVLLAGQWVHTLLAATIRPRSRTLKFRVSIPRMIPEPQLRLGELSARSRLNFFGPL